MQAKVVHPDVGEMWSAVSCKTLLDLVGKSCERDPYRPALIFEEGLLVTRQEFLEHVEYFAAYLAMHVQRGERVAVMLENRAEYMIALVAIMACGASLVSIAPTAQEHDTAHILRDSQPVVVIAGKAQRGVLEQVCPSIASIVETIYVGDNEPSGLKDYRNGTERRRLLDQQVARDSIVTIYYTSGTTGTPKGCLLDHEMWLRILDVDLRTFPRGLQDRQLCCLPFYYADPALQLFISLHTRGTMVAMRRFSVSRFWDVVYKYGVTEILSIASIPTLLLKGDGGEKEKDHCVRQAIAVGLSAENHAELIERFGFPWLNNYGATEAGIISRVPLCRHDAMLGTGTIGVPMPEVEVRVVDEQGHTVACGEVGEFVVRGPGMFRGYLNKPEAMAEVVKDGWYFTGDLGREDEAGYLYFVGRKKDIIRRSGENIAAAEVEDALRCHAKILDVAVVPVPDELRGEEVKAYVLLRHGETPHSAPPEDIVAFCTGKLAGYKVPRYIEYRSEEFPRSPSMRVLKQVLRAEKDDLRSGAWDRDSGKFGA